LCGTTDLPGLDFSADATVSWTALSSHDELALVSPEGSLDLEIGTPPELTLAGHTGQLISLSAYRVRVTRIVDGGFDVELIGEMFMDVYPERREADLMIEVELRGRARAG
jgi:hypothetical protein